MRTFYYWEKSAEKFGLWKIRLRRLVVCKRWLADPLFGWGRALAWGKKPTEEGGLVGPKMGSGDAGDANGVGCIICRFWGYMYTYIYRILLIIQKNDSLPLKKKQTESKTMYVYMLRGDPKKRKDEEKR